MVGRHAATGQWRNPGRGMQDIRFMGVLQRIAFVYLVIALVVVLVPSSCGSESHKLCCLKVR